jgi:hypothetical protein
LDSFAEMLQKAFFTTFGFGVTGEREYRYYQGLILFLHLVALSPLPPF